MMTRVFPDFFTCGAKGAIELLTSAVFGISEPKSCKAAVQKALSVKNTMSIFIGSQ